MGGPRILTTGEGAGESPQGGRDPVEGALEGGQRKLPAANGYLEHSGKRR